MQKNNCKINFQNGVWLAIAVMVICITISICIAEKIETNTASVIGGALSAIATVFVGLIAIWQNTRYKKMADEANDVRIRPEFFAIYNDLQPRELSELPTVSAMPTRLLPGETMHEELLCLCKVLDFPVVRITPNSLRYLHADELSSEYYQFEPQNEPNQILEKGSKFRILIPSHAPLFDVELELKYENIYGEIYIKQVRFIAPPNSTVPEASVFGKYASGQIVMQPAKNNKYINH